MKSSMTKKKSNKIDHNDIVIIELYIFECIVCLI